MEFCVKNSSQFIDKVFCVKLNSDEFMVSFDVVSLFTSVPINEVKILIFDLLSKDCNLCKRTKLTVQDIMLCLELCFNFTVFLFKNTMYQQVFGAPMGSCISPVVANIFMAHVGRQLSTLYTPPTLKVCFVDDTFCVIKCFCVEEFHDHLDGISSFIKFTYELEMRVDCHFWMFLLLLNTMALQPLQFITKSHTQIAPYNSLHTTQDITNFL